MSCYAEICFLITSPVSTFRGSGPSALGAAAFKAGGAGWRDSIQAARKREEAARADGLFYLVDVGNSLHRPR